MTLVLLAALIACVWAEVCLSARARRRARPGRAASRLAQHVARRAAPARLRRPAGHGLRRLSGSSPLDRRLLGARAAAALERDLRDAGLPLTVSEAILAAGVGAAAIGGAAAAVRGPAAGVLAATVGLAVARWGLAAMRDRRLRRLDLQLPAALDLLIAHLRAHRSAAEAITEVAQRLAEPLRGECSRVVEEVRIGASLQQALEGLRHRTRSRPLGAVATAILVSDRTGGNLAELLARQAGIVRSQVAFLQEVRALTAHARCTAVILTLLPLGVAAAMFLLSPAFLSPMLAPGPGRALLVIAAMMEIVGWRVIHGMIRSVEQ